MKGYREPGGTVHHPTHYNACGERGVDGSVNFEPIKIIEAWGLSWGFCAGNALKYILRAPYKGSEREDLEKALWYLQRLEGWHVVRGMGNSDRCKLIDVVKAWGLEGDLATAVHAIFRDDPIRAADYVAAHLEKMEGAEQ